MGSNLSFPVWYVIYGFLRKYGEEGITDKELYEKIVSENPWISLPQISEALLKLEAVGKIRTVRGGRRGTLIIELVEGRKHGYVLSDED
ncbi:MAG TPA: hypothetical protein ENG61_00925 [Candidatus Korarchaeota archaeon]|nr:MAG: hypothetical protein DRO05_06815 [Candidatus Korarchaeota archaeon]RLG48290.1 MAG: hypothetical protein DRN90_03715 [Candidatus Korarchaeota archaeon]HDD68905.1 hypothetical protein [Candidatus Korarchaeota archaeon]